MKYQKIVYSLVAILFLFVIMARLVVASESEEDYRLISIREAAEIKQRFLRTPPRLFLYSKAFAERFDLDVDKATEMDERLFAIKLEIKSVDKKLIEEEGISDIFMCQFSLYLDSQLDIAYPLSPFAEASEYTKTTSIIRDDLNLTRVQLSELYRHSFLNRLRIATDNFDYNNSESDNEYDLGLAYHRVLVDALKGVTYFETLGYPCIYFKGPKKKNWQLWLLKPHMGSLNDLLGKYGDNWHDNWDKYKSSYEIIPIPSEIMEFSEAHLASQYNRHYRFMTSK